MACLLEPPTFGEGPEPGETLGIDLDLLLRAAEAAAALHSQHASPIAPPDTKLGAVAGDRDVALFDPRRGRPLEAPRQLRNEKLALDLHVRIEAHSRRAPPSWLWSGPLRGWQRSLPYPATRSLRVRTFTHPSRTV